MTKKKTINLSSNRTIRKASTDDFTIVSNLIEQGKAKMIKLAILINGQQIILRRVL